MIYLICNNSMLFGAIYYGCLYGARFPYASRNCFKNAEQSEIDDEYLRYYTLKIDLRDFLGAFILL